MLLKILRISMIKSSGIPQHLHCVLPLFSIWIMPPNPRVLRRHLIVEDVIPPQNARKKIIVCQGMAIALYFIHVFFVSLVANWDKIAHNLVSEPSRWVTTPGQLLLSPCLSRRSCKLTMTKPLGRDGSR
jgi:hypothetical protein